MKSDLIDVDKMNSIPWWHTIDLGHGITTPGKIDCRARLADAHFPADFSGKTVLDIGAWDGFFSFEAERRGADRVVALDHVVWNTPTAAGNGKAGFDFAHAAIGSKVETYDSDVYDMDAAKIGTFDVVIFMGVLYHIKDPFYVMHKVAPLCRDLMIFETHVDFLDINRPAIGFYEGDSCAGDFSNWCGPNRAALDMIFRDIGFDNITYVSETPPTYGIEGESDTSRYGRAYVHARRS